MSTLAAFFVAVALADACRHSTTRRWPTLAAGPVAIIAWALLCGLWHAGDIALLAFAATSTVLWSLGCYRAERDSSRHRAPLALFGGTVAGLAALSGWSSPVAGLIDDWLSWVGLTALDPTRAVMIAGVMAVQLATGNEIVRLILGAVGIRGSMGAAQATAEPQPSDRLKGGRLLGPMERLFIVGLGLGGQLGAASIVVAAKSIIRFPELSAQRKEGEGSSAIDEVTEYFLVGSFASWLLAMAGLALVLA
ncbi:hypothetical protein BH10ACT9_BH10ACT9_20820 [soil metagenome]